MLDQILQALIDIEFSLTCIQIQLFSLTIVGIVIALRIK